MKRLALLLALAAPLAASAAESGLVIFHTQCSRCHGEDGRGKAVFTTPSFLTSKLSAAEMEQVISKGRGKMPAFSTCFLKRRSACSKDSFSLILTSGKAGTPRFSSILGAPPSGDG